VVSGDVVDTGTFERTTSRLAMLQAPVAEAPGKREYDADARDGGRDRAVVVAERMRRAGGLLICG
jgi:hypothetical protein